MEADGMEDDSDIVSDETEPEAEKSPMATAMSETYSNVEGGKYSVLHAITYIYLVLAHLTDSDLSDDEVALIKKKLHKYCDEYEDIPIDDVVADTILWYDEGTDEDRRSRRVEQFDAVGAFLKESDWFEKGLQKEFLQDMVDVAKVDDNFHKYEKQVIRDLAVMWEVQDFDFTGTDPWSTPVPAGSTAGEEIPEEPEQDDVSSDEEYEDEEPEPRQQRSSGMRTLCLSGRMSVGRFEKEFEKLFGVRCEVKKGGRYAADDASLASLRPKDFKGQKTVVFGVRGNMKVKSVEKKFNECFGLNLQLLIRSNPAADKQLKIQPKTFIEFLFYAFHLHIPSYTKHNCFLSLKVFGPQGCQRSIISSIAAPLFHFTANAKQFFKLFLKPAYAHPAAHFYCPHTAGTLLSWFRLFIFIG
jgi:hypothetical protein